MSARACEIVIDIIDSWPTVSSSDIVKIRDIVMRKKFAGTAGLNDEGLVILAGEVFQEMMFLYKYLNIETITNKKLKDDEIWYISKWLKSNRVNDIGVKSRTQGELSEFIGKNVYFVAVQAGEKARQFGKLKRTTM